MKTLKFIICLNLTVLSFACYSRQENVAYANPEKPSLVEKTLQPTPMPLTETDIKHRDEIQKQMLKGENLHDGSITLKHIGDINSVPALLIVLKKKPPYPNGTMICTTSHAVMALQKITGANVGYKYEDWNNWWIKYQENQKTELKQLL